MPDVIEQTPPPAVTPSSQSSGDANLDRDFMAALASDDAKVGRKPDFPLTPARAPETPPANGDVKHTNGALGDDDYPEEVKTPKAKEHWTKLRNRAKEAEAARDLHLTKIKEFEAKLKEPAQLDDFKKQLEAVTKERDEFEARVRKADLANHPKFKTYFEGKFNQLVALGKNLVPTDKAAILERWLTRPDSEARTQALEALTEELGGLKAVRLGALLNEADKINAERDAELEKAKTDWEEIQQRESKMNDEQQTRSQAESHSVFEATLKSASDPEKGLALLKEIPNDEAWNKSVAERKALAKTVFETKDVGERAKASVYAASYPALKASAEALIKENAALKAELAGIRGAGPKPPAPGGEVPPPNDDQREGESWSDGVERRAKAAWR